MKIAFIMICHKNPDQVKLLIDHLLCMNDDVYIHIDRKSVNFQLNYDSNEHVYIIPSEERVDVRWGQISQVDAILKLIQAVFNSRKTYDYVWLISGQDLPLRSISFIHKQLESNGDSAYINFVDNGSDRYRRLLKRNEIKMPQKLIDKTFGTRLIRAALYVLTGGRYHTFKLWRRHLTNTTFCFGDEWWCLPYRTVASMIQYTDEHPEYYQFYSYCLCPDESYFQTLFFNHADFNGKISDMPIYIDWTNCKNSPRTLTMNDYKLLCEKAQNGYLFARKFDAEIDNRVISELLSHQTKYCEDDDL